MGVPVSVARRTAIRERVSSTTSSKGYIVNEMQAQVTWKVIPTCPPRVVRPCERCGRPRSFDCSEKFRVNANQKKLDAWLIYKCTSCDLTWKCTIFSRLDTRQVDRCLLRHLQANHQPTAWVYAFDYGLLRRNGVEVEPTIAYTIVGEDLKPYSYEQGCVTVLLTAEQPLLVRIDTLLARKLGLSRAQLGALFTSGGATIDPANGCALRDKLKRDVMILIDRAALRSYLAETKEPH
jgi:hypothetical protein